MKERLDPLQKGPHNATIGIYSYTTTAIKLSIQRDKGPCLLKAVGHCSVQQFSCCSTPGFPVFTISWSFPKLMSIESVMPSNHPILCLPLILLPSVFPSIRVFSNESPLRIRWPSYWSFSSRWPYRTQNINTILQLQANLMESR